MRLDRARSPFFEHSDAALFLARDADGEPVGRIAAIRFNRHLEMYGDGVGFFGFFECVDDESVAGRLFAAAAEWLQPRMQADGVDLFIGDTVARAAGQTAHLESGQTWDFDALVQAVGITPVFPAVPGLEVGRGIRIDAHCRTNLPGVYAAGDCTETRAPGSDRWRTTRIWLDCARQGRVAGQNMAGQESALSPRPFFNASLIYTVLYAYVGEPHGAGGEVYVWQEGDGYRKVRVVDGKLAGALLLVEERMPVAIWAWEWE